MSKESPDKELLDALHRISEQYCLQEGGSHGPDHSERVFQTAMAMGRTMNARLNILAPAALLHDIGRNQESRSRGNICHAEWGAEMAIPLLRKLDYSEADITSICHCIRGHRFRSATRPESLEAKILFDADKLDSIGAIGIGRASLPVRSALDCTMPSLIRQTRTPIPLKILPTGNFRSKCPEFVAGC